MNRIRRSEGFTLTELIVVIAIIGILSVVIAARYSVLSSSAKTAICIYNQASLETACSFYYADAAIEGDPHYPSTLSEIVPYITSNEFPECPENGTYSVLSGGRVTCSIPAHQQDSIPSEEAEKDSEEEEDQ